MDLSILSQNIWNKNYYWEKRKPLIIGLIKEFEPDIIAIQEIVGKSIADNQLTEIASKLNDYEPVFTLFKKDTEKVYDLGLLSKYKVEPVTPIASPACPVLRGLSKLGVRQVGWNPPKQYPTSPRLRWVTLNSYSSPTYRSGLS